MRGLKCFGWVVGALVVGAGGVVLGVVAGWHGAGPGIAVTGLIAALWMVEKAGGVW